MRENSPDFLMHECNAHICCLYYETSNPGILLSGCWGGICWCIDSRRIGWRPCVWVAAEASPGVARLSGGKGCLAGARLKLGKPYLGSCASPSNVYLPPWLAATGDGSTLLCRCPPCYQRSEEALVWGWMRPLLQGA
jgi:hypothetical protein